MVPALRTVLFGHHYSRFQRTLGVLFAVGILIATFTAYALGLFQVTGGVIVLPADATLVGFVAAVGIGSRRGGLVFAWLAHFAAYAGFRADWAFTRPLATSLAGKLAFLSTRSAWLFLQSLHSSSGQSASASVISASGVSIESRTIHR